MRQLAAHVAHSDVRRQLGQHGGRVVALDARDRPAEPQPRLELADRHQRAHPVGRDQRALDQAVLAQGRDDALLVARELEVDIELDALERAGGEMGEAVLQRGRLRQIDRVVVRKQEPPAAIALLGQHVELDHVDAGRERGVERRRRVAGNDQVRALVADSPQRWQLGHQYVLRLSSPWPRAAIRSPQRGHGSPALP
jgi:hypothetical protein